MVLEGIKTWYEKNERKVSLFALFLGFLVDSFTLRGSDKLPETLILLTYLCITAFGIIVLQKIETDLPVEKERGRTHFWAVFFTQFALGGLFSAFFIFYFRSAVIEVSFPLLLILFVGLIGNELFKKKVSHLVFQVSILFFALCSFAIFFVPTLIKDISLWSFLLSMIFALIVFYVFIFILSQSVRVQYEEKKKKIFISTVCITVGFILFYILNIIPPLPLVMKDSGVYHSVSKLQDGSYVLKEEKHSFFDFLKLRKTVHVNNVAPLYVWSAIYSPIQLNTTVVHSWKRFDSEKSRWVEVGEIPIKIVGGRNEGYRLYSVYPYIEEGSWRVDVTTETGQVMGRIKFNVKKVDKTIEFTEVSK